MTPCTDASTGSRTDDSSNHKVHGADSVMTALAGADSEGAAAKRAPRREIPTAIGEGGWLLQCSSSVEQTVMHLHTARIHRRVTYTK